MTKLLRTSNRRQVLLLAMTLAVVMLGFGVVIPVFPFYIESMGASGNELGLLVAVSPLIQLLFAPIWGVISDRIGRKPVLMVGILGYGISMFLFGLATELWMLYVIRAGGALLSSATLPTTFAYIGDVTSEEDRSGAMGMLGAATALGMLLGPGIGGWLATDSLATPFFVTAAVCAFTLVLIALVLPESLPPTARSRSIGTGRWGRRVWDQRQQYGRILTGPIGVLLLLTFLVGFGLSCFQGIFGLWALDKYGYGPQEVGWIMTGLAIASAVTQGVLTGPLTTRYGEARVIKATLLVSSLSFLLMLVAQGFVMVMWATIFFALPNALLRVALMARTSQQAEELGQGAAMGLSNSALSLGRIIGPVLAGYTYDINIHIPYIIGAVVMTLGFLLSLWAKSMRSVSPTTSVDGALSVGS